MIVGTSAIVVDTQTKDKGSRQFDAFFRRAGIVIEPVTEEQAHVARQAYDDFGKGRHPASLNFGDCFAYTPTPTSTPTETAVPTPTAVSCAGDCNGKGQVTVDDILTLVNIALGNADLSACEVGDGNDDGQITVDEILQAVNNALNGCPNH
jgi:hypothetical protein